MEPVVATAARYTRQRKMPTILWPILALVTILAFNAVRNRGFFHIEVKNGRLFGSLIDIPDRAAPVMLLAIGMTLVIATGGVDLSVGAIMAIAGSVSALMIDREHAWPAAVWMAIWASLLAGVWNGLLVAWVNLQPIVATLILMVAGRGIAQLLTDGQIITVDQPAFNYIGGGFLFGLPFTISIVAAMLAITWFLTRRTAAGLFIESVGNNATASQYAGINARFVKVLVYTFSGLCAGLAGLIAASDIKAADANNAGLYLELDAILAVVIGGTSLSGGRFLLAGSIIGALIVQSVTTTILTTRGIPPEANFVVKALVVIVVCLFQSDVVRRKLAQWRGVSA
jgi:simple sugar transport system permease protein